MKNKNNNLQKELKHLKNAMVAQENLRDLVLPEQIASTTALLQERISFLENSNLPETNPDLPHNLPQRRGLFVGRERDIENVFEALKSPWHLTCIIGIGGMGKTSLAIEIANQIITATSSEIPEFEGVVWITSDNQEISLERIIETIARTLNYSNMAKLDDKDKHDAIYKLLQRQKILLIIDNFDTIVDEQVMDFLLQIPEPSRGLITSRENFFEQAWTIVLRGLEKHEIIKLIKTEGQRHGLNSIGDFDDEFFIPLYDVTQGIPLAIKWALGQVGQRGQSLDSVLQALRSGRGNLFELIFNKSKDILSISSCQVLAVMPYFPEPALISAIEAISGIERFELEEALGQLVGMSLVDSNNELDIRKKRYSIHSLTRFFALSEFKLSAEAENSAFERLVVFFEDYVKKHGGFWNEAGFELLFPDLPNIFKIINWCWDHSKDKVRGFAMFYEITDLMMIKGYWQDLFSMAKRAIDIAASVGDEAYLALFKVWPVSWLLRHKGQLDAAQQELVVALSIFQKMNDEKGIAYAKRNLGRIAEEKGKFNLAEEYFVDALHFHQNDNDKRLVYFVTSNLASLALKKGDLDKARELSNSVLDSARQFNDPLRTANLIQILAQIAFQQKKFEKAKEFFEEVLICMKKADRLDGVADTMKDIALVEIELGQIQNAIPMLLISKTIYTQLDINYQVTEIDELLNAWRITSNGEENS